MGLLISLIGGIIALIGQLISLIIGGIITLVTLIISAIMPVIEMAAVVFFTALAAEIVRFLVDLFQTYVVNGGAAALLSMI